MTDADATPTAEPLPNATDVTTYVLWGALALCVLVAVYALLQFYASAMAAIGVWVDSRYRPLFEAAFNLAVLLAAATGVSLVVRRLSA